jgi:hypothetical protein
MKSVVIGSFLVSALATGLVAYPKISNAATFWARHSAAECNTVAGGADSYVDGGNNLSSNSMILYCRTHDTAAQLRQNVAWVNVHVEDNSASAISTARCVKFSSASGGACGSFVSSSGTGQKILNPPTFAQWANADLGYIYVLLPSRGTGVSSKLNGYSMGD